MSKIESLSKFRLYSMKALYLLTFIGLAPFVYKEIFITGIQDPLYGVAFSFWAAYATLMLLGVRYTLQMLPLLLLQLFYKSVWLIGIAYPLWATNNLSTETMGMVRDFSIAIVLDLIIIPWSYVFTHYLKNFFLIKRKSINT